MARLCKVEKCKKLLIRREGESKFDFKKRVFCNNTCRGVGASTDVSAKKFGKWTVVGSEKYIGTNRVVTCRCDCGTIKDVYKSDLLRKGHRRNKGCVRCSHAKTIAAVGVTQGRLTIIEVAIKSKTGATSVRVKCQCGTEKTMTESSFFRRKVSSCAKCKHMQEIGGQLFSLREISEHTGITVNLVAYRIKSGKGIRGVLVGKNK